MITVKRNGAAKALKQLIHSSVKAMDEGRTLIIFPEGTRVKPGHKSPYKPGVNYIYQQLKTTVIPVALNSGAILPKGHWIFQPGKLVIEILPPIPEGLDKAEFKSRLEQTIEEASMALLEQN